MIRTVLLIVALLSGGGALTLLLRQPEPEPAVVTAGPTMVPDDFQPMTTTPAPEPVVQTTEVLSLRRPIAQGTVMQSNDFAWIAWPTEFLMSGFILREAQPDAAFALRDRIASFDLQPDEPVLASAFAAVPDTRRIPEDSVSRNVRPGMRAVPVRIQMDQSMFDLFNAGDRVDVVHVYFPNDGVSPVGRTVASNVRLLEITEQAASQTPQDGRPVSRTVLMELATEDATAVMASAQIGTLSLLLRAPADDNEPTPQIVTVANSITPGYRGVVLPDVSLTSAGLIRPNDRLDILFTPVVDDMTAPPSFVVVENSRVLEVRTGDNAPSQQREADASGSVQRASITVELDFAGTEVVTAAVQAGFVSVSLRSANDAESEYRVFPLPQDPIRVRVRRAGSF